MLIFSFMSQSVYLFWNEQFKMLVTFSPIFVAGCKNNSRLQFRSSFKQNFGSSAEPNVLFSMII